MNRFHEWIVRLRRNRRSSRLGAVLIAVTLLPVLSLGIISNGSLQGILLERLKRESENSVSQLTAAIGLVVEQIDAGLIQFSAQDAVGKFIYFPKGEYLERLDISVAVGDDLRRHYDYIYYKNELIQNMSKLKGLGSYILRVTYIDPKKGFALGNDWKQQSLEQYGSREWLMDDGNPNKYASVIVPPHKSSESGYGKYEASLVYSLGNQVRIVVDLDYTSLIRGIIGNLRYDEDASLLVLDQDFSTIYSKGSLTLGEEGMEQLRAGLASNETFLSGELRADEDSCFAVYQTLPMLGGSVLGLYSMDAFFASTWRTERLVLLMMGVIGAYFLAVMLLTSRFFDRRIRRIGQYIESRTRQERSGLLDMEEIYGQVDRLWLRQEKMEERLKASFPVYRQQFFASFLNSPEGVEGLEARLSYFGIGLRECGLIVFYLDGSSTRLTASEEIASLALKDLLDALFGGEREHLCSPVGGGRIAAAIGWEPGRIPELCELSAKLCLKVEEVAGGICYAGVGRLCGGFSELAAAYREALTALQYRDVTGSDRTVYIGDVAPRRRSFLPHPAEKRQTLCEYVIRGDAQGAASLYDELIAEAARDADALRVEDMLNLLLWLHSGVLEAAAQAGLPGEQLGSAAFLRACTDSGLNEAILRLRDLIADMADSVERELITRDDAYLERLYETIASMDLRELSLEQAASRLQVNPTYLSRVFRQKTGQKFIDYVTSLRIERAKALLRDTDLKLCEVAALVGWNQANYFNRVFREATGVTPGEYRRLG